MYNKSYNLASKYLRFNNKICHNSHKVFLLIGSPYIYSDYNSTLVLVQYNYCFLFLKIMKFQNITLNCVFINYLKLWLNYIDKLFKPKMLNYWKRIFMKNDHLSKKTPNNILIKSICTEWKLPITGIFFFSILLV